MILRNFNWLLSRVEIWTLKYFQGTIVRNFNLINLLFMFTFLIEILRISTVVLLEFQPT